MKDAKILAPEPRPPTDLDFEKALMYFHMYGPPQGKLRLYAARKIHAPAAVQSSDWEIFASILVRDVGTKIAKGVDLSRYEVKSATNGRSYEYQYHKIGGKDKLQPDMEVGHLFFDHRNNLRKVTLRYVPGSKLKQPFFEKWLREYPDPYGQRYRKNVPYAWVKKNGTLLMIIEEGEVTYPHMATTQ